MSFRLRTEVALLRRKQTFIKIDADWIKSLRFVCVRKIDDFVMNLKIKPKTEFGKLLSFVCVRIINELIEGNKQIPFACTILVLESE